MRYQLMTPRELNEYRALRDTIRQRGSLRIILFLVTLMAWAAATIATAALAALPVATLLPLLLLAAGFEAVFGLHTARRTDRPIPAGFLRGGRSVPPGRAWEHTAMAYGRAYPGGPDPLFVAVFHHRHGPELRAGDPGRAGADRGDRRRRRPRARDRADSRRAPCRVRSAGQGPRTVSEPQTDTNLEADSARVLECLSCRCWCSGRHGACTQASQYPLLLRQRDRQQQRALGADPRIGGVERLGEGVRVGSAAAAADRDRGNAAGSSGCSRRWSSRSTRTAVPALDAPLPRLARSVSRPESNRPGDRRRAPWSR